jgi:hypothetical protein
MSSNIFINELNTQTTKLSGCKTTHTRTDGAEQRGLRHARLAVARPTRHRARHRRPLPVRRRGLRLLQHLAGGRLLLCAFVHMKCSAPMSCRQSIPINPFRSAHEAISPCTTQHAPAPAGRRPPRNPRPRHRPRPPSPAQPPRRAAPCPWPPPPSPWPTSPPPAPPHRPARSRG